MAQTSLRKALLVVTVTLLTVTAGCSGLLGGGEPSLEPKDELDGEQLTNSTKTSVEDAGSYTIHSRSTTIQGNRTLSVNVTSHVNFEIDRGVRVYNQTAIGFIFRQNASAVVYTDQGTSYRRQNTSRGVSYDTQQGSSPGRGGITPVNVTAFNVNYTSIVDSFAWESNGTTTVDGTETIQYQSTELTDPSTFTSDQNSTVTASNSTVLLDRHDVVRELSIEFSVEDGEGQTVTVRRTLTLSNIGSTTVNEPGWLPEAQATPTPISTPTQPTESTDTPTESTDTPTESTDTQTESETTTP